jgi:2,3-bisphosphoglycerate-dependent phosphoglycerate mutase
VGKLILLRHGASLWNEKNIFTGWVDIPLSTKGIDESLKAGKKISSHPIDVIFVSELERAMTTALLAMSVHSSGRIPRILHTGKEWDEIHSLDAEKETIPVIKAWQLNERMYGELQGMNKDEMRKKFGDEQVHLWRRSYDVAPPEGESLKMTAERTIPYFREMIIPYINAGKTVFVAAHGNSLRSIVMDLEKLTPEQVVKLEIPTGEPLFYSFVAGLWVRS